MGGMETTSKPQLLPLGNMARRLGVTSAWLRREALAGRVPALQADSRLLFVPEIVEQVLAERAAALAPSGEAVSDAK